MDIQQFIDDLNIDLSLERSAQIQYEQHQAVLSGYYFAFASDFLIHAEEEHKHALSLTELIIYLGGIPTAEIGDIKIANDISNCGSMVDANIESEQTAIDRYKQRLSDAVEFGFPEAVPFIQEILTDEIHHINDLKSIKTVKE